MPHAVPEHVLRHVSADCRDPGAETLGLFEPGKLPARMGQRLLGGILRQMVVQQNGIRHRDQRGIVPPAKLPEALRVRLQGAPHKNVVLSVRHASVATFHRAALYFHYYVPVRTRKSAQNPQKTIIML